MSVKLSRAAFADFKSAMRSLLPPLRSSHADEALAQAFGFATYAAWTAATTQSDNIDAEYDAERLRTRLIELGYMPGHEIGLLFRTVAEMAHERIFERIRSLQICPANDNGSSASS